MKKNRTYHLCLFQLFLCAGFLIGGLRYGLHHIEQSYQSRVDDVLDFPASSEVFDRNGELLYEFIGEIRRIPVSSNNFPQSLINATLMAEDEHFFVHAGFDPFGIVRAAWRNMRAGEIKEGASTIGQQLVKNTVLGPSEGYQDKIDEVLFSIALDARMSKDRIIHTYLNTIPYGSNVYGAEAASRLYFRKSIHEVSLAEAATLAALPKSPTTYSPYGGNVEALMIRRDYILTKMRDGGLIAEKDYQEAIAEPTTFASAEMPIKAPHFVMEVRKQLEQELGKDYLEQAGLKITTSLDYQLQKQGERIIDEYTHLFEKYNADSAGLIAMDPMSGEIIAMIGNRNYFSDNEAANVNMTTVLRQPGSAFKPIAYAALLDRKPFTPASILWDVPTNFSEWDEPYIPQNYDLRFRGPISVRDALSQSLNVPAVQALMLAGLDTTIDLGEDMGLSSLSERERFGPSIVLGGAEVRMDEMLGAYSTFADKGMAKSPDYIKSIETRSGETILADASIQKQVIHPETAYQISSILSDTKARAPVFGVRSPLSFYDRPVAAKTGTTQEYRDAWTIGYTPSLAVGVWVGNHDNKPLRYGSAGAVVAAPIWRAFMGDYVMGSEPESFEPPQYIEQKRLRTVLGYKEEYVAWWQLEGNQGFLAQSTLPFYYLKLDTSEDSTKSES